ncbi:MAG: TVP38/TMEM64 family protein [Gammaproteobacteria bacterium]
MTLQADKGDELSGQDMPPAPVATPGWRTLAAFLAVPLTLIALFYLTPAHQWFADNYRSVWQVWVAANSALAIPVFLLVFLAFSASGLPRVYPTVLAGSLFSLPMALGLALIGSSCGSVLAFRVARGFGRPWVEARFGHGLGRWGDLINRGGFSLILLLRLMPGTNALVTSMVGGVSRIPTRVFAAATLIGIAPSSVAFALLGRGLSSGQHWQVVLSMLALLVLAVSTFLVWRRRNASNPPSVRE